MSSPQEVSVGSPALREEHVDEGAGVHAGVRVGEGQESGHQGHYGHLQSRVVAQSAALAEAAPENVGLNEEHPYQPLPRK